MSKDNNWDWFAFAILLAFILPLINTDETERKPKTKPLLIILAVVSALALGYYLR